MPASIVWYTSFIVVGLLAIISFSTTLFFLRRILKMRQWQDIYLTLVYILIALSTIPLFTNLLVIPVLGINPESQNLLLTMWRFGLSSNLVYLLPLAAFAKMTFRSDSRITSFYVQLVMFSAGFLIAFMFFFLSYTFTWDEGTWLLLYNYDNISTVYLFALPVMFVLPWFFYETFKLYLRERRKDTPNPIQLRRFSLLTLSSVSLIINFFGSSVALSLYTPEAINTPLGLLLYVQPYAFIGAFVILSSIGWIMPKFATKRIEE
ncbi:MAG: hypothetical protein ACFE9R_07015 [Candidatus Hermodarchaeota archaeon]